jgi:hypothetical protein
MGASDGFSTNGAPLKPRIKAIEVGLSVLFIMKGLFE